jgi:hypothetical protein
MECFQSLPSPSEEELDGAARGGGSARTTAAEAVEESRRLMEAKN